GEDGFEKDDERGEGGRQVPESKGEQPLAAGVAEPREPDEDGEAPGAPRQDVRLHDERHDEQDGGGDEARFEDAARGARRLARMFDGEEVEAEEDRRGDAEAVADEPLRRDIEALADEGRPAREA